LKKKSKTSELEASAASKGIIETNFFINFLNSTKVSRPKQTKTRHFPVRTAAFERPAAEAAEAEEAEREGSTQPVHVADSH
jgi:hypothetical protein